MKTYRVYITQVIRDVRYRSVEVQGDSVEAAEAAALKLANEDTDGTFWDDAKVHPLESEEPEIDDAFLTCATQSDADAERLADIREECKADYERTGEDE
jgi:hypothetical protein